MKPRELIDFLTITEKLKCHTRHSWTSSGRQESVAEHSYQLAMMAYFMKDEFPDVDITKVILMCLIHDWGEAITGDIPAFEKTTNDEQREEHAITSILLKLNEPYQTELTHLFQEMNEQQTVEAKLYKALDKMETLIQHNAADISTWLPLEYELNFTYGTEQTEFSDYLKELKKEINQDSQAKIDQEAKKQ